MTELGFHGKDQNLKGVTGARLGSHKNPMGRTRTSKGSLEQDPYGSLLSHPGSHKQDSCGCLGQHWDALERGRILADISVASSPSPPESLAGTNAPMAQLGHMKGEWGPVAMPPQLPQPNPGAEICPQWCPQIRWGANTHRVFVPPGSPGAGAATLSSRRARAGLYA